MGTGSFERLTAGLVDARGRCLVPMVVGPAAIETEKKTRHGHAIAPPQQAIALVDSGCSGIELDEDIITKLGLIMIDERPVRTAAGMIMKRRYTANVRLLDVQGRGVFAAPNTVIRSIPLSGADYQALIGWTILKQGRFSIDGPARRFSLEF